MYVCKAGQGRFSVKNVVIVQRVLPHYRAAFFRQLYDRLASRQIDLNLIYGDEFPGTVPTTTPIDVPWARKIENRYLRIHSTELVWQPCWRDLRNADLVIV